MSESYPPFDSAESYHISPVVGHNGKLNNLLRFFIRGYEDADDDTNQFFVDTLSFLNHPKLRNSQYIYDYLSQDGGQIVLALQNQCHEMNYSGAQIVWVERNRCVGAILYKIMDTREGFYCCIDLFHVDPVALNQDVDNELLSFLEVVAHKEDDGCIGMSAQLEHISEETMQHLESYGFIRGNNKDGDDVMTYPLKSCTK